MAEAESAAHRAILASAELVALDVDGVLTDGRIVYGGSDEIQRFHVRDGQGLAWLHGRAVRVAWITGRGCDATLRRARELGVEEVSVRSGDKAAALEALQDRLGIGVDRTVAMGDDLPDLALRRRSALLACPSDAHPLVRERAELVTRAAGGRGAVRELVEAILRARGEWDALVARYAP